MSERANPFDGLFAQLSSEKHAISTREAIIKDRASSVLSILTGIGGNNKYFGRYMLDVDFLLEKDDEYIAAQATKAKLGEGVAKEGRSYLEDFKSEIGAQLNDSK